MLVDHLEKLKYFYEVAKLGSFNKASKALFITQPSLTKSLQVLESSLAVTLLLRTPKGVQLTREGQVLFRFCIDLFSKLQDVENNLNEKGDATAGSLRIGTYDSIAVYFWPHFIKHLQKKYPEIEIELVTNRSSKIISDLENGLYDLTLCVEPRESRFLKSIDFINDRFDYFSSGSDSHQENLIYMKGVLDSFSSELMAELKETFETKKVFETSSLESVKAFALNGVGIAILPGFVAKQEVKLGRLVKIRSKSFPSLKSTKHKMKISFAKERESSPLLKTVIEELLSFKSQFN